MVDYDLSRITTDRTGPETTTNHLHVSYVHCLASFAATRTMTFLPRRRLTTNRSFFKLLHLILMTDAALLSGPFRVQSSPQSAEKWELNAEFFTALSRWTLDHPDSTLDHILRRVSDAIDSGRDYLDLIPNSPFPAQSLMKSLTQLIQLSAVWFSTCL